MTSAHARGLLHRHVAVHRLQGVRGRLQGVERGPRGRPRLPRAVDGQHGRAGRRHVAPRRVRRAAGARRGRGRGPALAHVLRRLQALHARRVPGGLPDRLAVPHGVRHRRRAGGHLQRLRLLRPGVPVRRARPARGGRPRLEVHALLRPPRRRPGARVREGVPDGLDPVRAAGRPARARQAPRDRAARARRGVRAAVPRRPGRRRSAARARSSSCSTSRRSTACRPIRSTRRATSARRGARPAGAAGARAAWRASPARLPLGPPAQLLRPAGPQAPGLDVGDPRLLLRRRRWPARAARSRRARG